MNPDDLTPQECAIMLGLVREGIKKARRTRTRGARRWGEVYDSSVIDREIELLHDLYVKLGGDPKRVSERSEHVIDA